MFQDHEVTTLLIGMIVTAGVLTALTATAQMRFPPAPLFEMPCGLLSRAVVCAPRPEDSPRVARELAAARLALVRLSGLGAAAAAPVELQMDGLEEALGRFRARQPPGGGAADAAPGLSLPDILRRLQDLF
jgi:hypothetical protein